MTRPTFFGGCSMMDAPVVAGRLAGAFRRDNRAELADEILTTMKSAGHYVRETDPFAPQQVLAPLPTTRAAYRRTRAGTVGVDAWPSY